VENSRKQYKGLLNAQFEDGPIRGGISVHFIIKGEGDADLSRQMVQEKAFSPAVKGHRQALG